MFSTPTTGETFGFAGAGVAANESFGEPITKPAINKDANAAAASLRKLELAKSFLELKNFDDSVDERIHFVFGIATPFCAEHGISNIGHRH